VPCAIINALPDAVAHPQAQALGIVQRVPGDDDLTLISLPLSFNGERPAIRRAPPTKIGEHDHELRAAKGRWPR
jgi:formyl-CoA transferase